MTTSSSQPEKRKPKSLWGVMGEPEVGNTEGASEPPSTAHQSSPPKGKGLWGVMGGVPTHEHEEVEQEEKSAPNKKSASIDQNTSTPPPPIPKSPSPVLPATLESATPHSIHAPGSFEDILSRAEAEADLASQAHQVIQRQHRKSWYDLGSLFAGLVACLLSLLSYLPEIYWKLPASAIGLVAIIIALLAFDESRKRNRETSNIILPVFGILLGIVAMFAGPFIFTPWGDQNREDAATKREAEEAEETSLFGPSQPKLGEPEPFYENSDTRNLAYYRHNFIDKKLIHFEAIFISPKRVSVPRMT